MDIIKTYVKKPEFIRAVQWNVRDNDRLNFVEYDDLGNTYFRLENNYIMYVFDGDYITFNINNNPDGRMAQEYFERWFIESENYIPEINYLHPPQVGKK